MCRGEQTGGWLAIHDHRLPAGAATPLHVQPDDDASFVVLEGAVEFFLDGVRIQGAEGDALHIPRAFRVASAEGARLLGIGTPAGHERFFEQAGDPLEAPAPPDLGRMAEAAAAAGLELLGPPPF